LLRRGERRLDQILAGLGMLRRALRMPEVEIRDDEEGAIRIDRFTGTVPGLVSRPSLRA